MLRMWPGVAWTSAIDTASTKAQSSALESALASGTSLLLHILLTDNSDEAFWG